MYIKNNLIITIALRGSIASISPPRIWYYFSKVISTHIMNSQSSTNSHSSSELTF